MCVILAESRRWSCGEGLWMNVDVELCQEVVKDLDCGLDGGRNKRKESGNGGEYKDGSTG